MRILIAFLCLVASPIACAAPARYVVSWDGGAMMHVRAQLETSDGKLAIAQGGGIDHIPDQWAGFVRNLVVKGVPAARIESAGKEGWRTPKRGALSLRYDVDLRYAEGQWPAGNEQAGRRFPTALFTVTKPLFIYTTDTREAEVRFELPDGWQVAAPWPGDGERRFTTSRIDQLSENTIVLGAFPRQRLRVGALDLTIATPSEAGVPPELARLVAQLGALTGRMFPSTPPDQYLVTYFRETAEDGEAYVSSAAFTSPDSFGPATFVISGNSLVHELLHYWIGHRIHAAAPEELTWFQEGFTEYYATRLLAASGTVPPEAISDRIANRLTGYEYFFASPLFNDVTLRDAGKRKSSYRFGNYNGGWAIALALDIRIRQATGGRASLDDAMRQLFAEHGLGDSGITIADVANAASAAAGEDLAPFLSKYVETREKLPTDEMTKALGWGLIGQPYAAEMLLVEEGPTPLREAMFGPARGDPP